MRKNIFKLVLTVLALCSLLLCLSFKVNYPKLADNIVLRFGKKLNTQYGLRVGGLGGAMMDDVKLVDIYLVGPSALNIGNARELYVYILEELIDRFNANQKIRPYLHNYPFTYENFDLRLSFPFDSVNSDCVSYMYMLDGNLFYHGEDSETKAICEILSEPYAKAKEVIRREK